MTWRQAAKEAWIETWRQGDVRLSLTVIGFCVLLKIIGSLPIPSWAIGGLSGLLGSGTLRYGNVLLAWINRHDEARLVREQAERAIDALSQIADTPIYVVRTVQSERMN